MTWKTVWTTIAGKRRLSEYRAHGNSLTYTVEAEGGFCTVKRFCLTALFMQHPRLLATFWSLAEAKAFAEGLENGGVQLTAHTLCPAYV